ncbi:MAG: imelysin family protein [Pseudomonadota bacterium]
MMRALALLAALTLWGATALAQETPLLDAGEGHSTPPLLQGEIEPALDGLAGTTRTLQNAVLRHCVAPSAVTRDALGRAFDNTVEAAALFAPLAFGHPLLEDTPTRFFTEAESTAISRARLRAMMARAADAPATLARLADEDLGLTGLSALERLLLAKDYSPDEALSNRCILARTIAANLHQVAGTARALWSAGAIAAHWRGEAVELAERLRLRDLLQGASDAVDRFERDVTEYARQPRNNGAIPFARPGTGRLYLRGLTDALLAQMGRIRTLAAPEDNAEAILSDIEAALVRGRQRLMGPTWREGAYLVAFQQATDDITQRLPGALGFDARAFRPALTSFDRPR